MRFVFLVGIFCLMGVQAQAQVQMQEATAPSPVLSIDSSQYIKVDFPALVNLYWKSSLLKTNNEKAVQDYIALTACDFFKSTFTDDFKWPEVLESTKDYIEKNSPSFKSKFYLLQTVSFDRYDLNTERLPLIEEMQYRGVLNFEIASFEKMNVCPGAPEITAFPRMAEMRMQHPFSLTGLDLKPDEAKRILDAMKLRDTQAEVQSRNTTKYAHVYIYITATGLDLSKDNSRVVHFTGRVDGYEVYLNRDKKDMIAKWVKQP